MSKSIQKTQPIEFYEAALVKGDLSGLSSEERIAYYKALCNSLGLNPLTKPFEYFSVWDKRTRRQRLVLYPTRACADQLRAAHGVSIEIVEQYVKDGVYYVHVRARTADGRTDEDVGAASLVGEGGQVLGPEEQANAIMKAITKAKRRVTLSICGLGWTSDVEMEDVEGANIAEINAVEVGMLEEGEAEERAAEERAAEERAAEAGGAEKAKQLPDPRMLDEVRDLLFTVCGNDQQSRRAFVEEIVGRRVSRLEQLSQAELEAVIECAKGIIEVRQSRIKR